MVQHWWLVALMVAACGGDDRQIHPDAAALSDAEEVDAKSPLEGTTAITATFYANRLLSSVDRIPLAGAAVRLETAAGEFLESTTAVDGTVAFMVDVTKGPFDVSFAKRGFAAVSIVDVTAPIGAVGTDAREESGGLTVSGAITNKLVATERVVVSRHSTVAASSRTATYSTRGYGPNLVALPVIGMEVTDTGVASTITQSTPTTLTAAPNLPLAFPATPPAITTVHATLDLPTTGVVTAAALSMVVSQGPVSAVDVFREQVPDGGAAVGTGTVGTLVDHTRALELQTFAGDFAPTSALAVVKTATGASTFFVVAAALHPVSEGATITVAPVAALASTGDTLDAVRIDTQATGYRYAEIDVIGNVQWIIYAPTATLAQRALPHLPSTALESIVEGKPTVELSVTVMTDNGDGTPPWQDYSSHRRTFVQTHRTVTNAGR